MPTNKNEQSITEHERKNCLREFDAGISKLRYELAKNLAETDILKSDKLENVISVFNERLIVFQHDFLQVLAQMRGDAPNRTSDLNLEARRKNHLPKVVGGIVGAAAGTAAAGLAVTTATTTTWYFWTSTHAVTLASFLAGGVGLSVGVVSGGLALGGGVVGAVAVNKLVAGSMRKRMRKRVMEDFEVRIVPQLQIWAEELLSE